MSYTTQTQFSTSAVWLQLASVLTDKDNLLADTLLLPNFEKGTSVEVVNNYYTPILDKFVMGDLIDLATTIRAEIRKLKMQYSEDDDEHLNYSYSSEVQSKLNQLRYAYVALNHYIASN